MATLDQVIKLQQEGKSNNEIMAQLQNKGISPSEINNAINQANIKNAVSPPEQPEQPQQQPEVNQEMQPSIMPTPTAPTQQEYYEPQPQQEQPQQEYYTPQPQAYEGQDSYLQSGNYEAGTISEIAEQVAIEKLEEYKTKVGDLVSFKNQIQTEVENIDDRLKRMENSIGQIQQAVLGKIGEFGENYATIHKDLENLHGTVAKLMNPLIDNFNEMKKLQK